MTYDHQLSINGTASEYYLVRDDNGKAMYEVSAAEVQYEPQLTFTQFDWIGGHGQCDYQEGDKYFEGQSIDTTQKGKVFLGPEITEVKDDDGSVLDSTPTDFFWFETVGKWLCWTAGEIYSLGTSWEAATTTVSSVKQMVEMNGIAYASVGSGTAYYYSTDGTTWAQTDLTDNDADGFLIAPNPDGLVDNLWKFKAPNELTRTTDGRGSAAGGVQYETPTYIGETANDITNAFLNGDKLLIGKEDGLYWLDSIGGVHPQLPDELKVNHSTDNFKYVTNWQTSSYFSLQKGMGELTTAETFRPMGPLTEIDDIGKVGSIVGITSDRDWVYVAVDEGTNTIIYKGREVWTGQRLRWEWCPFVFLGTNACATIKVCQHSTTIKRLWFGYGSHTGYVVLSDNPLADSTARFCTSGWLRMSYTYGTNPIYDKLWQSVVLETSRFNSGTSTLGGSGESAQIKYRDDADIGAGAACVAAHTTLGVHESNLTSALNNKRVQFELWLASDTNTATPVVSFFQAKGIEKPTTVRTHEAYYRLGDTPSKRTKTIRTLLRAGRDSTTLMKFADLRYSQTVTGTTTGDYTWCVMEPGFPREVEIKHEKQRSPELAIQVKLREVSFTIS